MADQRDRYAQLMVRIWDDPDWVARSPRAQWLYMLLLSQAELNRAGIISLKVDWWASLADGGGTQQVESAISELERERFIVVDRRTMELLVRSYIRNSGVAKQPNVLKRALREVCEVHSPKIRAALVNELHRIGNPLAEEAAHALDSPVKANANPSGKGRPKGSGGQRPDKLDNGRSEHMPEGFAEPLTEGFAEPRVKGEGLGSSPPVGTDSSSETSSSSGASRRPDIDQLCTLLHDRIVANGSKTTITEKWRKEARLLLDRDKRPLAEAVHLIEWCQAHPFWDSNILSMPTFRKQYDKLRMQEQQARNFRPASRSGPSSADAEVPKSTQCYQRGIDIAEERRARRRAAAEAGGSPGTVIALPAVSEAS